MSTMQSRMSEGNTCLSEDIVLAFQRGETSEAERQHIHGHIDDCHDCRRLLIEAAAIEGGGSALDVELDSMERLAAVMGSGLRATTFAEGKRLARRFDVTRFVDRGGMGEVYEAFDNVVGARVALKALLCTTTEDDPGTSRLGEEVKLARRVAHPNVCRIYDMHEHREAGHQPLRFLAMEFVEGVTLKERMLAGKLPLDEACSIARQLLLGLDAVHSAGVLHLDFKCQNVMLRHGRSPAQPVVMDFSLSRAFEKELRLRTSERRAAGSIGYMSPEQLECRSTIGPAADVYAFGVVFYELLTGHMPFEGDSPAAIMLKQLKSRAAPPSRSRPGVSPALDEFVLTCLSRHARSRFQTVTSAIEAFDRCMRPAASKRRLDAMPGLRMLGVAVVAAAAAGTLVHLAWRMTDDAAQTAEAPTTGNATPASDAFALGKGIATSPRRVGSTPAGEHSGPELPSAAPPPVPSAAEATAAASVERREAAGIGVAADAAAAARAGGAQRRPAQPGAKPAPRGTALARKSDAPSQTAVANAGERDPAPAPGSAPTARPLDEGRARGAPPADTSERSRKDNPRVTEPWIPKRAPDFLL